MSVPKEMCTQSLPMVLQLGGMIPPRFMMEECLVQANERDCSFNSNMHKATAFKAVCAKIAVHHGEERTEEPILRKLQHVPLSFKCEDEILDWEVQEFWKSWACLM